MQSSDGALLRMHLGRHVLWSVQAVAALTALAPVTYLLIHKLSRKHKAKMIDSVTVFCRTTGSSNPASTESWLLSLQRRTDDDFAAEVAGRARGVIVSFAKKTAARRALSALDMIVGFGVFVAIHRRVAAGASLLGPLDCCFPLLTAPPLGMSLFAFYDFAASSDYNVLLRLPVIQRLPRWLILLYLAAGSTAPDMAPIRFLPFEEVVRTSSACSARQLALWQFLACAGPATIGEAVRLALTQFGKFIHSRLRGKDKDGSAATRELSILVRRTVARGLLSAWVVHVAVSRTLVEGGLALRIVTRCMPQCVVDQGPGYALSCVVSALFVGLLETGSKTASK